MNYVTFISALRKILNGFQTGSAISGHSFRRGGATWAFKCGIPGEIIQEIGFWKSDAYLRYLEIEMDLKKSALSTFGSALPKS